MSESTKGSAAQMRDELLNCKTLFRSLALQVGEWRNAANNEILLIDAALAKPRKNCERFTDETDAQIAFLNEVWLISVSNLDRDPFDGWTNEMKSAYSKWLFAPATEKEGGAV